MFEKEKEPRGSRKLLGGKEFYTVKHFPTEVTKDGTLLRPQMFKTTDGTYIYGNGDTIDKKEDLECLPSPEKEKAIDWWEKTYEGKDVPVSQSQGPNISDLMTQIQSLQSQINAMQGDKQPGVLEEVETGETKESKRGPGNPNWTKNKANQPSF